MKNSTSDEQRVLALLHEAAEWEADSPPPLGMVGRALARRQRKRGAHWTLGLATGALACTAAIFLVVHLQVSVVSPETINAAAVRPVSPPVPQVQVKPAIMLPRFTPPAVYEKAQTRQRPLRYRHRVAAIRPAVLPKRVSIRVPSTPPRARWTTETVEETRYALLTPAVLTETSGEDGTEQAIPVFLDIPLDNATGLSEEATITP